MKSSNPSLCGRDAHLRATSFTWGRSSPRRNTQAYDFADPDFQTPSYQVAPGLLSGVRGPPPCPPPSRSP
jgi:hypothetical protein